MLAAERQLAVFDLENTLIASNVVESYAWLATRHLDDGDRLGFTLRTLRQAPRMLALDRKDRGDFLRYFYRRYEGAPVAQLREDAWELWSDLLLKKSFPTGIRRVREHRRMGHRTLLITGALDVVIDPLRPLFDDVVCARLGERDGRFTGELDTSPPTGEARALIMADYADANGLDLTESVAYADSASDLPMLEAVGHPVAVNPEAKLAAIARKRGWHVEHWPKAAGGPRPLLPDRTEGRMKALLFERSLPKFAAARLASEWRSGGGARVGPLRLSDVDEPEPARPRLAPPPPPAGRDLRQRPGHGRRPLVALLRADRELPLRPRPRDRRRPRRRDPGGARTGPALRRPGHRSALPGVRRRAGPTAASNIAFGHLQPGLQTGYCESTGGGWGVALVAHATQLHPVPEAMSDEAAVMVEPTACAIHGALTGAGTAEQTAVVIGAGTLGLCTIAAIARYRPDVQRADRGRQAPRATPAGRASSAPPRWWSRASCAGPCGAGPDRCASTAAS